MVSGSKPVSWKGGGWSMAITTESRSMVAVGEFDSQVSMAWVLERFTRVGVMVATKVGYGRDEVVSSTGVWYC